MKHSSRSTLIWGLLALLLMPSCLLAQTVGTQPGVEPADRSLSLLYPGGRIYKYDQPYPLVFEFSNTQSLPRDFEFEWSSRSPVPPAWRRFTLGPGEKRRLSVVFASRGVSGLYSATLNGRDVPLEVTSGGHQPVVGILAPTHEGFDYLRSLAILPETTYLHDSNETVITKSALTSISRLDAQVLPETWGTLAHLDVIVAYDLMNLGLNRKQLEALLQWTQWKGHLVLVSNGLPDEFKGTPFEDWLPLEPKGLDTSNNLSQVIGDLRPGAEVQQSFHGKELLTSVPVVNGRLFLITAPLTEMAPLTQTEAEQLWEQVVTDLAKPNDLVVQATNSHLIESMPELPKLQPGYVALLILVYALIVGPINLSYLRKKDLMLWSFVTIPAIAVAFAASIYILSLLNRSSVPVLREVGVLSLKNGELVGAAASEILLFSPSNRTYTLMANPSAFFGEFTYRQRGGRIELYTLSPGGGLETDINLSTWDLAAFESRALKALDKPISVTYDPEGMATIVSSLATETDQAALWLPDLGTSKPFTLKVGENLIPLEFSPLLGQSHFLCSEWLVDDPPGRERMLNQLNYGSNMRSSDLGYLLLWTSELPTALETEPEASRRSDTLILIAFKVPAKDSK